MSINLSALMKQRYDTAANWTAQNPTLLAGEIGIESDTKRWKIGSGSTAWTSLTYANGSTYPFVNADIAAGAEIAVSKLADGSARQLLQTDAAGTGVEWTSDVSIPGALSVTGNVNIDGGTLYVDVVNNRVGINTTSLAETLHLGGTSGQVMRINGVDTAAYFGAPGTNLVQIASNRSPLTGTRVDGTRGASFINLNATTNGGSIDFATASGAADASTKATIDSSGRLLVGVSANANGGILQLSSGITFPATAVAASDANTLDDYEEGTWTPTQGVGLTVVGTFSSQGFYTKIGNIVYVTASLKSTTSITSATGGVLCDALPFTPVPPTAGYMVGSLTNQTATITNNCLCLNTPSIYGAVAIAATAAIHLTLTFKI